jgi:hypothetical protein
VSNARAHTQGQIPSYCSVICATTNTGCRVYTVRCSAQFVKFFLLKNELLAARRIFIVALAVYVGVVRAAELEYMPG